MRLTRKVLALLVCTIFGALALTTSYELSKLRLQFAADHITAHKIIITNLMSNLSGALFNLDDRRVQSQVASAFGFGEIKRIIVIDDKAQVRAMFFMAEDGAVEEAGIQQQDALEREFDLEGYREPELAFSVDTSAMISDPGILRGNFRRFVGTVWHHEDDRKTFVGHIIFEFGMEVVTSMTKTAARDKIISAIVLALALFLSIFLFLQKSVLSRLEYLRRAVHRIAQRDYSVEIRALGTDEIGVLGHAFQTMSREIHSYQKSLEEKVLERTRQLQESRDKIRLVLDTIDQGIVTFDANWSIEPEFSRKAPEILGHNDAGFSGKNILDLLSGTVSLSEDEFDRLQATLSSVFEEDEVNWEANAHNLPREVEFQSRQGKRYLALNWEPIVNSENGLVERVLLDILDLTDQKALEEQRRNESARNQKLIQLVKLVQRDSQASVERFLARNISKISELKISENSNHTNALITLHTLKGEARTLGFSDLSDVIHEAESRLKEQNYASAKELLQSSNDLLEQYLEIFRATFDVSGTVISDLVHLASRLVALGNEQLAPHGRSIEQFELFDHVCHWSPEFLENVLMPSLIHGMRNVIDHGYIFPEKKFKQAKNVCVSLKAKQTSGHIRLELSDSGYGIDEQEVIRKAKELGMNTEGLQAQEIIFQPEFSTASSISESSGRGVGMAAIREMVANVGGQVWLESKSQQGSQLILEFPAKESIVLRSA